MTREERLECIERKLKILNIKFFILGVLCVTSGSKRYFYYGYINNSIVTTIVFLFLIVGWSILSFLLLKLFLSKSKKTGYKKNRIGWLKYVIRILAFAFTITGACAVNMILISDLADNRIVNILNTQPTITTEALVTGVSIHNTCGGPKTYAVIEYYDNYVKIQQEVYNGNGEFKVGSKYALKFAVDYPEMYIIYR